MKGALEAINEIGLPGYFPRLWGCFFVFVRNNPLVPALIHAGSFSYEISGIEWIFHYGVIVKTAEKWKGKVVCVRNNFVWEFLGYGGCVMQ